jgi:hypothetical protein
MNSAKSDFPYIVVSTFNKDYEVHHKFHAYYMYFNMKCTADIHGKKYLFIRTNAGGSGSLNNFSLIDSTNGKLVITSESQPISIEERRNGTKTSNFKDVIKILGMEPKSFSCKNHKPTQHEICLVSAVELG